MPAHQLEEVSRDVLNLTLARRRRKELGLTLAEVGQLVGVGRDVIQRWETGSREPRNLESLRRYARALQLDLNELAAEPDPEPDGEPEPAEAAS